MSHNALYFSKIVVKKLHVILTQMNVHFITMTQLLLWWVARAPLFVHSHSPPASTTVHC